MVTPLDDVFRVFLVWTTMMQSVFSLILLVCDIVVLVCVSYVYYYWYVP